MLKAIVYVVLRTGFSIAFVAGIVTLIYSRGWLNWVGVSTLVLLVVVWNVIDQVKKGPRR